MPCGWSLGEACQEKGDTTQEHPTSKTGIERGSIRWVKPTPSAGLLGLLLCGCIVSVLLFLFLGRKVRMWMTMRN